MPTFLESLFGKKKPTAATASAELAKLEADLAAVPARIARAEAKLKRVGDLTDEQHAAAEAELAAAKRSLVRLEDQVDDLRDLAVAVAESEAAAALRARAEAADRAMQRGYPSAVAEYEIAAAILAEKAAVLDALDSEVHGTNYAIKLAREADPDGHHPDVVKTSTERYRTKPDIVVPDREEASKEWFVGGRELNAMVTVERDGRQVPTVSGAELRTVKRIIPGETRRGAWMDSPTVHLQLPAARLDAKPFWPRSA